MNNCTDEHCTWQNHVNGGETPPGQTFWGKLNWLWHEKFCLGVDGVGGQKAMDVTETVRELCKPNADGTITIG